MSDNLIKIEVDGQELEARRGQMIIEVTDAADIYIPRFCYHEKLSIAANCRMCLVDVEKAPKPLPACATPVADGMQIRTKSAAALDAQRATMEFLLINHPLDCPICDQGGECELQDLAMGFGRDVSRFAERKRAVKDKNIGPLVSTDMTRCIHCTRCVRFTDEIAGLQELGTLGRGEHMEIGTFVERSIDHEMSGNIIDLCPVGALNSKPFRFRARGWEMAAHPTVAPHDCVGSNLYAHVFNGRLMRVVPRPCEDINETWLSDRDRFSYEGIYSDDRLLRPRMKQNGEWREVDWETALSAAAKGIRKTLEKHGAEQLGALMSPSATLEEHYLAGKLLRGLGSNSIDHRLRRVDFADQANDPALPTLGIAIAALEQTDACLIVGANLRREAPILAHRVRKAALRGSRVSVLNPPGYEYLHPLQNYLEAAGPAFVRTLAGVLAAAAQSKQAAVAAPVRTLLEGVAPTDAQRAVAAALIEGESAHIMLGHLATRHPRYSSLRALACELAAVCGATVGELAEAGNSVGACLAGAQPHRGVGARASSQEGATAARMLSNPLAAYLLFNIEPELDTQAGEAALGTIARADFVVSLSTYANAAALTYADVLLPIGTFAETAGTYVNTEGRWQTVGGVAKPVGEARPGWKVLRVLGNQLELEGFDYLDAAQVRDEVGAEAGEVDQRYMLQGQSEERTLTSFNGTETVVDVPMYAIDPLLRRAQPLQDTRDGRRREVTY